MVLPPPHPPAFVLPLGLLALPFDALRFHYARAVLTGALPRSLLASAQVERGVDALERAMLGAMARRA